MLTENKQTCSILCTTGQSPHHFHSYATLVAIEIHPYGSGTKIMQTYLLVFRVGTDDIKFALPPHHRALVTV